MRSTGASSRCSTSGPSSAREAGRAKAAGGRRRDPRRRARARGPAPGDDGQHRPDATGRPAGALPSADGRDPRPRGGATERGQRARPPRGRRRRADAAAIAPSRAAGPGSRRPRPATSTSATSRTRSGSGGWPGRPGGRGPASASRTTTATRSPAGVRRGAARGPGVARVRRPTTGRVRQSDDDAAVCRGARTGSATAVLVYGCDCSRSTFEAWARDARAPLARARLPGRLPERAASTVRSCGRPLGGGTERWMDVLVGPCADEVGADGDLPIRDRDGNWTYAFSVVVDDLRQGIDLVVRGRDLLDATAAQIRLGTAARPRASRDVRPSPAGPAARRPEAVQGRRGDRRSASCAPRVGPPPALIGEAAAAVGLIDASPADRGDRGRGSVRRQPPIPTRVVGPVLHLPGVVEGVPGDPPRGVARRPLAVGRAASRPTGGAGPRASPRASPRSPRDRRGRVRRSRAPSPGRNTTSDSTT